MSGRVLDAWLQGFVNERKADSSLREPCGRVLERAGTSAGRQCGSFSFAFAMEFRGSSSGGMEQCALGSSTKHGTTLPIYNFCYAFATGDLRQKGSNEIPQMSKFSFAGRETGSMRNPLKWKRCELHEIELL